MVMTWAEVVCLKFHANDCCFGKLDECTFTFVNNSIMQMHCIYMTWTAKLSLQLPPVHIPQGLG